MADRVNKRTLDKMSLSLDTSQSKKHEGGESPKNEGDFTVSIYSGKVSLSDKLSEIAADVCGHCNESCDAEGVKGEAFKHYLCEGWFPAACEGWFQAACENISSNHYKSFSSLAKSILSMVHYCKHNKCQSQIKCI